MFAYVKFNTECKRHEDKDIVDVTKIKHFNLNKWKNKYHKIKCGTSFCMGLIIFVEDTIDELKKLIATKRVTLPPRNIRESATETDAEDNFTAKKKEKSEEIREVLKQKINDLEKITINEINQENRSIGNKNRKSNQQCISKDKSEKNETKRTTECNILLHYNLEKENKTLKLQILEKNSKIDEQSTQIRELSTLNIELQKNIISYFDEFKGKHEISDMCRERPRYAQYETNTTQIAELVLR
ncbi:uncharacterized protein LOC118645964 [Monomorium pharaonis]|uniref:uncharacterized protein LOC118645964 n=1 Tax=Monomorium pharaonis TaxID=307658 RepID=UPI001746F673|nr:uncharacterized protein LOC118645964 [Monomorium pharaonis]